jgi:hypothetical protein
MHFIQRSHKNCYDLSAIHNNKQGTTKVIRRGRGESMICRTGKVATVWHAFFEAKIMAKRAFMLQIS